MKGPEDEGEGSATQQNRRGPGRPRIENPLTPAQRAQRYRARRRADAAAGTASAVQAEAKADDAAALQVKIQQLEAELAAYKGREEKTGSRGIAQKREGEQLRRELDASRRRIADLTGALQEVVRVAAARKPLSPAVCKGLVKLLAAA